VLPNQILSPGCSRSFYRAAPPRTKGTSGRDSRSEPHRAHGRRAREYFLTKKRARVLIADLTTLAQRPHAADQALEEYLP